ncbi:MAG: error-prone DNA polymerase, partial [bacterium]
MPFTELCAQSNFTFLTGASHPEDYMLRAAELGFDGLAVADVNSVAGIVRAHTKAREMARDGGPVVRLIPAARLVMRDGFTVTALPDDRRGWGRLCRLLTLGGRRAPKGQCDLGLQDLLDWGEGITFLLHPLVEQSRSATSAWVSQADRLARQFPGHCHLLLALRYDGLDLTRFAREERLARRLGIDTVASCLPMMHHGARRKLADVLAAIRLGVRIEDLGQDATANAEQRLRSEGEMLRLFKGFEPAVHRAGALAQTLRFSLDELRYEYPSEIAGDETAAGRLARLAREGLRWRYPAGAPEKARAQMEHELDLIGKLKYEPYFLTVHDIVAFARERGILCQGRGSAANSIVCYALGVTSVSPEVGTMVFERFVSEARNEPPDI